MIVSAAEVMSKAGSGDGNGEKHARRAKAESLANMLHALRTPLNAVLGFSEALKDGLVGQMSATQLEHIGDIFNSGQQMLSLINDIQDLSKVEAGTAAPEFETGEVPDTPRSDMRHAKGANFTAVERRERIALVIDDDDKAADLLRLLLGAEGFTVLRALSGEDALRMAPQQTLALITLDLELYGINGWQVLQQIRESSTLARVPVVIISGHPVGNLALARGAGAVLQKPFSRVQLKASLADLGLHPARMPTP